VTHELEHDLPQRTDAAFALQLTHPPSHLACSAISEDLQPHLLHISICLCQHTCCRNQPAYGLFLQRATSCMVSQMCSSNLYTSTTSRNSGFSPNPTTLFLKHSIWHTIHDSDMNIDNSGDRRSDTGLSIASIAASV